MSLYTDVAGKTAELQWNKARMFLRTSSVPAVQYNWAQYIMD